jgi:hypothetical protein
MQFLIVGCASRGELLKALNAEQTMTGRPLPVRVAVGGGTDPPPPPPPPRIPMIGVDVDMKRGGGIVSLFLDVDNGAGRDFKAEEHASAIAARVFGPTVP